MKKAAFALACLLVFTGGYYASAHGLIHGHSVHINIGSHTINVSL